MLFCWMPVLFFQKILSLFYTPQSLVPSFSCLRIGTECPRLVFVITNGPISHPGIQQGHTKATEARTWFLFASNPSSAPLWSPSRSITFLLFKLGLLCGVWVTGVDQMLHVTVGLITILNIFILVVDIGAIVSWGSGHGLGSGCGLALE